MNITHPNDDELEIVLTAPDGTVVPLTVQNGGSGSNYTATCFSASASTSIKQGTAPFTGSFIPEGYLGAANNGQNANGVWSLCIQDRRTPANGGSLQNWSITFNNSPAPPPPAIPACSTTIPGSSSCATATSVCDFSGVCGNTSGTTIQDWPGSGLRGCFGLENNSFVKFVASSTSASFSVWVPTTTTGGYNNAGIQMLFFSGTCGVGAVTTYGCYPHIYPYPSAGKPLVTIVNGTGFTPGNTYYLMIDGFFADKCNYIIEAASGVNILDISPSAPTICEGQSVSLTATGGNGIYAWAPPGGLNTITGSTVIASPSSTITYTVTSATVGSCPITKDVTVTVKPTPSAPLLSVVNNCGSSTVTATGVTGTLVWSDAGTGNPRTFTNAVTLTVTQTVGGCPSLASNAVTTAPLPVPAAPVLSVVNDCGISTVTASGVTGTLTWSDGGTGNPRTFTTAVTLTATQTVGTCPSITSNTVTTAPLPVPSAPVLSVVNNCGSSTVTASSVTGTLTWSDGGTGNPRTFTTATTISVNQTSGGCTSISSNSVTTAPLPVPTAPVLSVVNNCGNSVITASGVTGTLTWSDGGTGNPRTVTTAGTFTVIQTVGICPSVASNAVTTAPLPVPATPVLSVVNSCGSSTITASGVTGTLTWSDGGTGNPRTVTNAGTFTVTQSNGSCSSLTSNTVTTAPNALPSTPAASATVQPTCVSPTGTIEVTSPVGANLEYSINGILYQSATIFTALAPATYNVTVRDKTTGCLSASRMVTINAAPSVPFKPTVSVAAQPTCTIATGNILVTAPTGANLEYSIDGANYQASPIFNVVAPGTYNVTVRNTSSTCVSLISTVTVNNAPLTPAVINGIVSQQPTCSLPSGTIVINSPLGANLEYSINGTNYQTNTIFSGLSSGDYNVVVRYIGSNCSTTLLKLTVAPFDLNACRNDIYFPSAFTPNGDFNNDEFGPGPLANLAGLSQYSLQIFNRYGETVFYTTSPYSRWNGTYKGKISGNSNYTWQCSYMKANGFKDFQKGTVIIIK
jgi:gliding motility-associated-like protein